MIGFYNYTVLLTYAGFACGCCGIYYALSGHPGIGIILLLLAGFCDMFDGKVARTRKRTDAEKQFGIQIDSLSDLVCFGLLPAVIGYESGLNRPLDLAILVFFTLAALIRLAYFNVTEDQRQKQTSEVRKVYEGLPVTSVALIFPPLFSFRHDIGVLFPQVYGTLLLVVGLAFITRFKIKKPGIRCMFAFIGIGALELAWLLYKSRG